MSHEEYLLRQALVEKCLFMNSAGLNQGTSGNLSVRFEDRLLITPSATPCAQMTPELLASMPLDGNGSWDGPLKPSTEWRFHLDIMRARADVQAVVHAHPTYCTALAMTGRAIPAVHYMIAAFGGNTVRCAEYATYGTAQLSANALLALEGRNACLLANHGMLAAGSSLDKALWLAVELETLARQYVNALLIGNPVILSDEAMAETAKGFSTYGLQDRKTTDAA